MAEWDDPDYLPVLPDSVAINAAAGRQVEGFLDVSHFAFVHADSFGEPDNPVVPDYQATKTVRGFVADYLSTVSNYSHEYKHLNPEGFLWRRRFEVFLPFTAKLTVFFPGGGQLHILNAASPVSARKTRLFVPLCRNFDKESPLQATLDFNHQVFAEDIAIVERQFPEDLPRRSQFYYVQKGPRRDGAGQEFYLVGKRFSKLSASKTRTLISSSSAAEVSARRLETHAGSAPKRFSNSRRRML
jgi:vanillate O-demethylase monooxygenase subunit